MPNSEIAVVGLGPAGAFTARAAYDLGYKVTIYTVGNPNSTPPGAFWLHWVPQDVSGEYTPKPIKIMGKGTPEAYAKLQWGAHWYPGLTSSFPKEPVMENGYDPAEVLPSLVPAEVKIEMIPYPFSDRDVVDLTRGFEFVFQTFPRQVDIALQPERLSFVAGARFSTEDPDKNVVVYNGTGNGIVVREAMLFGNRYVEFPKRMTLQQVKETYPSAGWHFITLQDLAPNTQVVKNDPGSRVYLMGRYAQWDRRCLSHDCYQRTLDILQGEHHG